MALRFDSSTHGNSQNRESDHAKVPHSASRAALPTQTLSPPASSPMQATDGIDAARPGTPTRPPVPSAVTHFNALAPRGAQASTSKAMTALGPSVHPQATTAAALALHAQRAKAGQQRHFKTAGDMANFEYIAVHGPLPGKTQSAAAQAKVQARQDKEQAATKARRQQRRANRILEGIDNKASASASDEKWSNYALNSAHETGDTKARIFSRATGLSTISVWKKGDPKPAMEAAARNPVHVAERRTNIGQILSETRAGKAAERQASNEHRARMDTKHKLIGPTGSKTARVQWVYPVDKKTGKVSDAPQLGTIQPSDTSSDEG